jgi:site-specific recombinase XerD
MRFKYRNVSVGKGGITMKKHPSVISGLLDKYISYRKAHGGIGISACANLSSFNSFCHKYYPGAKELSNEMVTKWCDKRETETILSRNARAVVIRSFLRYTNEYNLTALRLPTSLRKRRPDRISVSDRDLPSSVVSDLLNKYISYKKASNAMGNSTLECLRFFNDYCATHHQDATTITENIINGWCDKRITESSESHNKRISPIRSFLRYANGRSWTNVRLPEFLPWSKKQYTPYPFSPEQLQAFFKITDSFKDTKHMSDKVAKIRKIEIPVFYRLLYSTGMRTMEARLLKSGDVDLKNGVINVSQSKGLDQHRIALHRTMWDLLIRYDEAMAALIPDRNYFFPNEYDEPYNRIWESYNFVRMWGLVSNDYARCYDFRSHYAVKNINSWRYTGPEWFDKLLYLSRSMGHRNVSSTCYYYQLVPLFAEQLEELTAEEYHKLLPDLTNYFSDEDTI